VERFLNFRGWILRGRILFRHGCCGSATTPP
jgi:hypothetical protein